MSKSMDILQISYSFANALIYMSRHRRIKAFYSSLWQRYFHSDPHADRGNVPVILVSYIHNEAIIGTEKNQIFECLVPRMK